MPEKDKTAEKGTMEHKTVGVRLPIACQFWLFSG